MDIRAFNPVFNSSAIFRALIGLRHNEDRGFGSPSCPDQKTGSFLESLNQNKEIEECCDRSISKGCINPTSMRRSSVNPGNARVVDSLQDRCVPVTCGSKLITRHSTASLIKGSKTVSRPSYSSCWSVCNCSDVIYADLKHRMNCMSSFSGSIICSPNRYYPMGFPYSNLYDNNDLDHLHSRYIAMVSCQSSLVNNQPILYNDCSDWSRFL